MKYMPKWFVNYSKLCWWISYLAHEYKALGYDEFLLKYSGKSRGVRGVYRRYLNAYIEYVTNKHDGIMCNMDFRIRRTLVADPCVYSLYFDHKERRLFEYGIRNAVSEMLKYGFAFDSVQEAIKRTEKSWWEYDPVELIREDICSQGVTDSELIEEEVNRVLNLGVGRGGSYVGQEEKK